MDRREREIERLEADAARLRAESAAARQRGDAPAAVQALNEALIVEEMAQLLREGEAWPAKKLPRERPLNVKPKSGTVPDVTKAQRRGRAIAKARAAEGKDPRRIAMAARWGSQAKAAKAGGVTPAALVGYLDGDRPCPRRVAERLAVDPALPADARTWPAGVTD